MNDKSFLNFDYRYYHIYENGEQRVLKTTVSHFVMSYMVKTYVQTYGLGNDTMSLVKYLNNNGIVAVWDGTFGSFTLEDEKAQG